MGCGSVPGVSRSSERGGVSPNHNSRKHAQGVSERESSHANIPIQFSTSFNKVLLATDFSSASQAAFQAALGVCTALQASLTILHVFEYANTAPPETGGQLLELDSFYQADQSSPRQAPRGCRTNRCYV